MAGGGERAKHKGRGARAGSLVLAAAVVAFLYLYPYGIGPELTVLDRVMLPFVLLAVGGALAFGLGFRFGSRTMNALISPVVLWPVIIAGLIVMIRY